MGEDKVKTKGTITTISLQKETPGITIEDEAKSISIMREHLMVGTIIETTIIAMQILIKDKALAEEEVEE